MSEFEISIPEDAKEVNIEGATVPFYEYTVGDISYIEFDTSRCGPPEPMVNAMLALKQVKNKSTKVIMINHKKPMGLLPKIEGEFDIESKEFDGKVKLIFSLKDNPTDKTDFNDSNCHG